MPEIARALDLPRQPVQRVVDELAERRLVVAAPNPSHRRSPHIQLTNLGSEAIEAVLANERREIARAARGMDGEDVQVAIRVLDQLIAGFRRG